MYSSIRYYILSDRIESGFATAAEKEEFLRMKEELDQRKQQEEEEQRLAERYNKLRSEPLPVFLEEMCSFDPVSSISSQELYEIYCQWCSKEHIAAFPIRSLCYWLKHKANNGVIPCTMVIEGKRCRGFRGLRRNTGNT